MQRLSVEPMRVAAVNALPRVRHLGRAVQCRTAVVGRDGADTVAQTQEQQGTSTPTSTMTIQPADPALSTSELQAAWRAGYEAGKAEAEAQRVSRAKPFKRTVSRSSPYTTHTFTP
jgi:hypothetical protein